MKKIYYLHQKYGSRQHYCLDEHNRLVPLCEVRFTKICPYAVAMENRLWHCADDMTLTPVIDCSEQDIQHISDQTGKNCCSAVTSFSALQIKRLSRWMTKPTQPEKHCSQSAAKFTALAAVRLFPARLNAIHISLYPL